MERGMGFELPVGSKHERLERAAEFGAEIAFSILPLYLYAVSTMPSP